MDRPSEAEPSLRHWMADVAVMPHGSLNPHLRSGQAAFNHPPAVSPVAAADCLSEQAAQSLQILPGSGPRPPDAVYGCGHP
jgi:hypothetical protein